MYGLLQLAHQVHAQILHGVPNVTAQQSKATISITVSYYGSLLRVGVYITQSKGLTVLDMGGNETSLSAVTKCVNRCSWYWYTD